MKVLWSTEGPLDAGWKEWWLLKQEKQSCMICLTQAVLSQLFDWKCCSMMMPSIMRMDILQLDSWCTVCHSTKSHIIQDLGYSKVCTRCVPQSLTVKWKTKSRVISSTLLICFKAQGETFSSWVVTADETWFHHLEVETKMWNGAIVNLPRRKNSNIFYQWARSWSLSSLTVQEGLLWQWCWDGRQSTLMLTPICLQNSRSVSNELGLARFQQNIASSWQCKAAYECEDPGSHYKICLDSITPPYSSNLAPLDFHPFGALKDALCTTKFETDDSVICTGRSSLHEQDKAWYWQSIPTLVPHWHNTIKVAGDFVEK